MALLALLFTWSASLPAQGNDPFPSVNVNKYADNMTIMGQVRMDGRVLGEETVIAVYQGDEIRGKGIPFSQDTHKNIFYINVYGDKEGEPLYFRVFTDGDIIEVDQGLTYKSDMEVGTPSAYYFVDLPTPVITDFTNEGWATICLPFNAKIPDDVKVWDVTGIVNGVLQIEQLSGTILPANTPVVLQNSPNATCKWISTVASAPFSRSPQSILLGTVSVTSVTPRSVLTFGYSTTTPSLLGFWPSSRNTIEANCAYINGTQGGQFSEGHLVSHVRNFDAQPQAETYYDLSGRKTAIRKGQILVTNGRKILQK